MTKTSTTLVLVFACLIASTLFVVPALAYKKKLLGAMMLGALLGSKPKFLPLPLILPLPIPMKHERVKYVPVSCRIPFCFCVYFNQLTISTQYPQVKYVPMPEPYPVYTHS